MRIWEKGTKYGTTSLICNNYYYTVIIISIIIYEGYLKKLIDWE